MDSHRPIVETTHYPTDGLCDDWKCSCKCSNDPMLYLCTSLSFARTHIHIFFTLFENIDDATYSTSNSGPEFDLRGINALTI